MRHLGPELKRYGDVIITIALLVFGMLLMLHGCGHNSLDSDNFSGDWILGIILLVAGLRGLVGIPSRRR